MLVRCGGALSVAVALADRFRRHAQLGSFDYQTLERDGSRYFSPIFFLAFMVLLTLILLNMFLAIIQDAYQDTQVHIGGRCRERQTDAESFFARSAGALRTPANAGGDDAPLRAATRRRAAQLSRRRERRRRRAVGRAPVERADRAHAQEAQPDAGRGASLARSIDATRREPSPQELSRLEIVARLPNAPDKHIDYIATLIADRDALDEVRRAVAASGDGDDDEPNDGDDGDDAPLPVDDSSDGGDEGGGGGGAAGVVNEAETALRNALANDNVAPAGATEASGRLSPDLTTYNCTQTRSDAADARH